MSGARALPTRVVRDGRAALGTRALPEEVPVALVYDGTTQAVMMASPLQIEDFARGFSLTEGIVAAASEIESLEIVAHDRGIEARMWLAEGRGAALSARRRAALGPVGCGLCGIDSLDGALRALPRLTARIDLTPGEIASATEALRAGQVLHDRTRAVHGAGFCVPGQGVILLREDVGRHNALDKLVGALAGQGIDPSAGALVVTSRLSVDMVQKAVVAGAPVLIGVSAPTALAVETAREAGLTLIGLARGDGYEVFTMPGDDPGAQDGERPSDVA